MDPVTPERNLRPRRARKVVDFSGESASDSDDTIQYNPKSRFSRVVPYSRKKTPRANRTTNNESQTSQLPVSDPKLARSFLPKGTRNDAKYRKVKFCVTEKRTAQGTTEGQSIDLPAGKSSIFISNEAEDIEPPSREMDTEPDPKVKTVLVKCTEDGCTEQFATVPGYRFHMKSVHKVRQFRCLHCLDESFAKPLTLEKHLKAAHSKLNSWQCPKCCQKLGTHHYLVNHWALYHEEGFYQCAICPVPLFSTVTRQAIHLHHLQEHVFDCTACSKTFPTEAEQHSHELDAHGIGSPSAVPSTTSSIDADPSTLLLPSGKTGTILMSSKAGTSSNVAQIPQPPQPSFPVQFDEQMPDYSNLLSVNIKEEELDEEVQIIYHPAKKSKKG